MKFFQFRGLRSLLDGRYWHVTSLEFLKICGCSILKEQCEGTGEDWYRIAHILELDIYGNE
ncbi:hypothetical protein MTR_5g069810 [Medicago truncatula]|uniref:Uncharacterized protein n=1 Tax=Medicago truncatula TaxID=3880 RepID=G7K6A8_MEDTR|nr:hypothetical protein MTR_5g069810 [Medicago truncatula]